MRQALDDESLLSIESTSNQVNQFGGYTAMIPAQFRDYIFSIARKVSLSSERILLGGDHLGPYPWRAEPSQSALEKAGTLVRECVLAGYSKIHLDASMACADDAGGQIGDETIASRAAELCRAAEDAWGTLPNNPPRLLYVIGTEVPVPGGETSADQGPRPTTVEHMRKTLEITRSAFLSRGLHDAWHHVIGLVVQPGVEFGNDIIFDFDRRQASELSRNLPDSPPLVYEAHSTDYQKSTSLACAGGGSFCHFESGSLADICLPGGGVRSKPHRAGMARGPTRCSIVAGPRSPGTGDAAQSQPLASLLSRPRAASAFRSPVQLQRSLPLLLAGTVGTKRSRSASRESIDWRDSFHSDQPIFAQTI